jgi:transcriptional regulator with XRE-family HTH domain
MKLNIEEIRRIRRDKDYSQEYMAHELGLSQSHYSRVEKAPSQQIRQRLFRIFSALIPWICLI